MKRFTALSVVATVFVASCGGSDKPNTTPTSSSGGGTTTTVDRSSLAKGCSVDAFEQAPKPVNVTYWHSQTQANLVALESLTAGFNSSQGDVKVVLQNQGGSDDTLTKYRSVAGSADAPDLMQLNETSLQTMIDSKAIVAAQACVDATQGDLDDLLPRVRDYYTVGGATWALPFNVSQPVMLYNKTAFRTAGLDPEKPPVDFDALAATVRTLKSKGGFEYGLQYKRDVWVLEQFLALAGEPYVDNDNGRGGRATKAVFDTPTATKVLTVLQDLVKSGDAITNPADGPEGFSNLFGICNGANALTFDSSGVLGTAYETLAKGDCKVQVEVGVAPLPLPAGPGKGGTLIGGGANFIARNKDAASPKVLAAYKFAEYLTTAKVQAEWAAKTGFIPISKSAANEPVITSVWAEKPGYKVAYDQLAGGTNNVATAGPLIGAYKDVRAAMKTALESLFLDSVEPQKAIAAALAGANKAISDYNKTNEP